jgi:uncharacterized protein (DUF2236 family)
MPEDDRAFQQYWKKLAERISKEHDRSKVIGLTQELIDMLDEYTKKPPQAEHKRYWKSA